MMDRAIGEEFIGLLDDSLKAAGVPYFLIQGTALGAYRDNGFTPTERDVDLGVLWEHLDGRVPALVGELTRRGMDVYVWCRPFTRPRILKAFHRGVGCDIVGWARWKGQRFAVCTDFERPYAIVHEAAVLESTSDVHAFGRLLRLPRPTEVYLEREYGPDWRTPREDHVSRTRVYDYVQKEGIPGDYLERPESRPGRP